MKISKTLRLNEEIIKKVKECARIENRNFSNMIETILNRAFINNGFYCKMTYEIKKGHLDKCVNQCEECKTV